MPTLEKPSSEYIQNMFNSLAPRYDLFNHLTSLGLDGKWRRIALEPVRKGMKVLDLGCGTGDLCLEAAKKVGPEGHVVGLDFSENMLGIAKVRARRLGLGNDAQLSFENSKAEDLPLPGQVFDVVVSGFVLRNIYQNIDPILAGVHRSLRAGGAISFLDITEPENAMVGFLWKTYMNTVVALYGKMLFGKHYPMFYLTESAKRFMQSPEFCRKLSLAGFRDIRVQQFMFGVITLYQAIK